METYVDFLKRLAESNSEDIINNSSAEHATALFAAMFRYGSGEARVLSGGLNPLIYARSEVIDAVTDFLSRDGSKMTVVMQGLDGNCDPKEFSAEEIQSHKLIAELKTRLTSSFEEKVSVLRAKGTMKDLTFHFTTIGNAFRFEPDRKKKEAFASFSRPQMVEKLNGIWDADIKNAESISLH